MNLLGRMDGAQGCFDMRDQFLWFACRAWMKLDGSMDGLAPFFIGHAKDCALIHSVVLRQDVFDIRRIDVEPAGDNDIADPVLEKQVAALIN